MLDMLLVYQNSVNKENDNGPMAWPLFRRLKNRMQTYFAKGGVFLKKLPVFRPITYIRLKYFVKPGCMNTP